VVFFLTVLGGILGKIMAGNFGAPCHIKNVAGKIPPLAWYQNAVTHAVVGGFLQFRYVSIHRILYVHVDMIYALNSTSLSE